MVSLCACTISMQTHQVAVGVVAVFFGHGQVHSQSHAVGKNGQKDYDLKGSGSDL